MNLQGLFLDDLPFLLVVSAFATVGRVTASRAPRNVTAWLFLLVALAFATPRAGWLLSGLLPPQDAQLVGELWGGAMPWIWVGTLALLTLLILVFPDGRPPFRSTIANRLAVLLPVVVSVLSALDPFGLRPHGLFGLANPAGIENLGLLLFVFGLGAIPPVVAAGIAAGTAVTARYRRADPTERLQLKWFLYGLGLLLTSVAVNPLLRTAAGQVLTYAGLSALPLAAAVAMLKYRLYQIDGLINRTLLYAALTGLLAGIYAISSFGAQRAFTSFSGQDAGAPGALAAFVVIATFIPLRNWLQSLLDRYLRSPIDPETAMLALTDRLTALARLDKPSLVARDLADSVRSALSARAATVDLVFDGTAWNETAGESPFVPAMTLPISHRGKLLGRFIVGDRTGGRQYSTRDRELVTQAVDAASGALDAAIRLERLLDERDDDGALAVSLRVRRGDDEITDQTDVAG